MWVAYNSKKVYSMSIHLACIVLYPWPRCHISYICQTVESRSSRSRKSCRKHATSISICKHLCLCNFHWKVTLMLIFFFWCPTWSHIFLKQQIHVPDYCRKMLAQYGCFLRSGAVKTQQVFTIPYYAGRSRRTLHSLPFCIRFISDWSNSYC